MKKKVLLLIAILSQLGLAEVAFANNAAVQPTKVTTVQQAELVDINSATKEQLMTLPGIGKSKADAIIAYREKVGRFLDVEQLTEVKGIGKAMFDKLKAQVIVK